MSQLETLGSLPVQPVYQQRAPNETIDFGPVNLTFPSLKPNDPSKSGTASLLFAPTASLEFEIEDSVDHGEYLAHLGSAPTTLTFQGLGQSIQAYCVSVSLSGCTYKPVEHPVQIRCPAFDITHATFHLMNWPDLMGPEDFVLKTGSPPYFSFHRLGRVFLPFNGWQITIVELENASHQIKTLKESDGYVVTHVGSIRRAGGETFTSEELDALLACLQYFFSFALGRWTCPSLTVGFNKSNGRVFEHWGLNRTTRGAWEGSHSWFDCHHAELLPQVFPGFAELWSNETWRLTLKEAIYWYIGANGGAKAGGAAIGVDASLLLSQAALELLAWTYCVKHRKMVSEYAFKQRGLNAADKLRLLASALDIPLAIPPALNALNSRKGAKWTDSMEAITDIRNGLVHPGTVRTSSIGASAEAWRLSLWYIELVLLRLFGHSGNYANRLTQRCVGTVDSVPWSK